MIKSTQWGKIYNMFGSLFLLPVFIIFSFYLWYKGYKSLHHHANNIKKLHSSLEQVDLKWLLNFALCIPILFVSQILRSTFSIELFYDLGDSISLIVIFYIGIILIQQREVYPHDILLETIEPQETSQENKSELLGRNAYFDEKAATLEQLMQNKHPYLNSNLNLAELAFLIDMRPQELSTLLNVVFDTNFYSYVNRYRIERCKELLNTPEYANFSMEGIAKEAGFKSKSTFYARFKEFTGYTPNQYLDNQSE